MVDFDEKIKGMFHNKVKFHPKTDVKTALADGKKVYYYTKGPSPQLLDKIYKKIPDSKHIPIVIETKKQYLNEYVNNQEKAMGKDFTPQERREYTNEELNRMKGVVSRYTTKTNKFIDPRVVFFADTKWTPKELKFSAWHEYGHELVEKKPQIMDKYSQNYTPQTAVTRYGATDPEEDFADRIAIDHSKDFRVNPFTQNNPYSNVVNKILGKQLTNDSSGKNSLFKKVPYEPTWEKQQTNERQIVYKDPFRRKIVIDKSVAPTKTEEEELLDTYSYYLDQMPPNMFKGTVHLTSAAPLMRQAKQAAFLKEGLKTLYPPSSLNAQYNIARKKQARGEELSPQESDLIQTFEPVYVPAEHKRKAIKAEPKKEWYIPSLSQVDRIEAIESNQSRANQNSKKQLIQYSPAEYEEFFKKIREQYDKIRKITEATNKLRENANKDAEYYGVLDEEGKAGKINVYNWPGLANIGRSSTLFHEIGHQKGAEEVAPGKTKYELFGEKTDVANAPTKYGKTNPREDFAESFMLYMENQAPKVYIPKEAEVVRKDTMSNLFKGLKTEKSAREIQEELEGNIVKPDVGKDRSRRAATYGKKWFKPQPTVPVVYKGLPIFKDMFGGRINRDQFNKVADTYGYDKKYLYFHMRNKGIKIAFPYPGRLGRQEWVRMTTMDPEDLDEEMLRIKKSPQLAELTHEPMTEPIEESAVKATFKPEGLMPIVIKTPERIMRDINAEKTLHMLKQKQRQAMATKIDTELIPEEEEKEVTVVTKPIDYSKRKRLSLEEFAAIAQKQLEEKPQSDKQKKDYIMNIPTERAWNMRAAWSGPKSMKLNPQSGALKRIKEEILSGKYFPIRVEGKHYFRGLLPDGRHRIIIYKQLGIPYVPVDIISRDRKMKIDTAREYAKRMAEKYYIKDWQFIRKRKLPQAVYDKDKVEFIGLFENEADKFNKPEEDNSKNMTIVNKENFYGDPFNPYSSYYTPYTNQFGLNELSKPIPKNINRQDLPAWERTPTS